MYRACLPPPNTIICRQRWHQDCNRAVRKQIPTDITQTCYKIVKMLYDAGAKEVHVRIASPEIKFPDFYGVDTPTKKELLAANKTNDEICEYINAKSLKFLSIDGMYRAMGFEKRNSTYPQLTDHYFTGEYPVKPIDNLRDDKVTQLSFCLLYTSPSPRDS